ncbi:transaldolase [Neptunomonas phycophila]|jgi:transaldolase|uniref:Transaldolase n=1 Tax=Neptunomonas phycophila TaxID=1572645 RepID=A0AAW7XPB3_9GAMM|nr:transaldolase [Neptunomonas phycophila]MBT3144031.1 transaldolase [Neptunomonas phycophila]MDO6454635.1 transaldolase [Neptunomonas phycophila]MDO6467380.1 transaldolase [Neptunomonas phycophila]MDP2522156.1 transaldolase [Neptunomonas phycophila]
MNLLEQLKSLSTVVADTGDLEAIQRFKPEDATTNPSLILKAAESGSYDGLLNDIVTEVNALHLTKDAALEEISDRLIVAMGVAILEHVPGRVSTEVDARLSFDQTASLAKARKLVALYEQAGVSRSRILIKLAATWEGIRAAEILEKEGIQCNLTLIFSFAQAQACAEAGVYLISPFVGRILDWFRKENPDANYAPSEEPGVESVTRIFNYFRQQGYPTVVMGASFRNAGEIIALAGCDRLTISPALLEELASTEGSLNASLVATDASPVEVDALTEPAFRHALNADAMATEKLAEGIRGFEKDQGKLEALILNRLG